MPGLTFAAEALFLAANFASGLSPQSDLVAHRPDGFLQIDRLRTIPSVTE